VVLVRTCYDNGRIRMTMVPEKVQVRVLSDGAGYIDTTRVAHREIPFAQLLDLVVAVAGLDPARISTILRAGTAVNGGYRYRWPSIQVGEPEITPMLERFPKPDPLRPFDPARCLLARIRAGVETIELPRDVASRRRVLQLSCFWDVLMEVATARVPRYENYSYRDGADLYIVDLVPNDEQRLHQAAPLLAVERTAEQVGGLPLERLTLYVKR
jgi:hypothetical protein